MNGARFWSVVLIVGVVLSIGGLLAWAEQDPQYGGTLVFGAVSEQATLDAANQFDTSGMRVMSNIFDNLVNIGPDGEPEPGLAESWDFADDLMSCVFHLRRGVQFHDGTPFDAEAVAFNFDRQMNPDNPYNQYGAWGWYHWLFEPALKSVEAIDDYTIRIELYIPWSPLIAHLAICGTGTISSPTAIKKWKEEIGDHPMGTGPFKLEEWIKGDHLTLVANEDYWGGRPYLDEVVIRWIPDNSVRSAALTRSEIDFMTDFSAPSYEILSAESDVNVILAPPLNLSFMCMNMDKEPFDDILVRLAVQHAIDKEAMVASLYGKLGESLNGPVPSPEWGYHPGLKAYEYDPELSKALLAAAGYPNGFETEILIYSQGRGYNPVGPELAEVIQSYLAKVGISARINKMEWTAFSVDLQAGKHAISFYGWYGDNLDPDGYIYTFCHSSAANPPEANNVAFFRDEGADELIERAQAVTDVAVRRELYFRIQEIVNASAGYLWLNGIKQPYALSARVQNYTPNPVPWHLSFSKVWVAP